MEYDNLLNALLSVINQTKVIAIINSDSVEATVYKELSKIYDKVLETDDIRGINLNGISRLVADNYGYNHELLSHIDKIEAELKQLG